MRRYGLQGLRRLVSPVFFSRDACGRLQRGLGGVPAGRPLLLVGNHQVRPIPASHGTWYLRFERILC